MKLSKINRHYGPIARTKLDLMGIRFADSTEDADAGAGDETETDTETETETPVDTGVDVSIYEAKILELTGIIAERDNTITALTNEVSTAKAANYDLLMSGTSEIAEDDNTDEIKTEANDVDIPDLFVSDKKD